MKLNVYVRENYGISRKEADRLIGAGKITVNGEVKMPAYKVQDDDVVELDQSALPDRIYLAYNKPRGLTTQTSGDEDTVVKKFAKDRMFPVGRLDKESEGLLIVTNDGRLSTWLLDPNKDHDKTYVVKTQEHIRAGVIDIMAGGMVTKKYGKLKPVAAKILGDKAIEMTLTEGKNHQIRIMLSELGLTVTDLKRTQIMNIKLDDLKPGETRPLTDNELNELMDKLT